MVILLGTVIMTKVITIIMDVLKFKLIINEGYKGNEEDTNNNKSNIMMIIMPSNNTMIIQWQ